MKFLYMSCFLFTDSILRVEMLRVIVRGEIFTRTELFRAYSRGEGDFSVEMEPDILTLFKRR